MELPPFHETTHKMNICTAKIVANVSLISLCNILYTGPVIPLPELVKYSIKMKKEASIYNMLNIVNAFIVFFSMLIDLGWFHHFPHKVSQYFDISFHNHVNLLIKELSLKIFESFKQF